MGFDLEREALIASGVTDDHGIAKYKDEIEAVLRLFPWERLPAADPCSAARTLFNWLWTTRPQRYRRGGSYRLREVIEAQRDERRPSVGNCLGLTVLYNCLLGRTGIRAGAIHLEWAFELAPHVLTTLEAASGPIDIENTLPGGFDYRGHRDAPGRTVWGDRELVADIYHSRGNDCFERKDYQGALADYEAALALNPGYETARLNRAIVLDVLENPLFTM
jgi:tetratricopeptide (TPR) repeat protein